jgi:hypothetical protein
MNELDRLKHENTQLLLWIGQLLWAGDMNQHAEDDYPKGYQAWEGAKAAKPDFIHSLPTKLPTTE